MTTSAAEPLPGLPASTSRGHGDRRVGVALVAVSAAAFGSLAIFAKLAMATGAHPVAVLFARFTIAGAAMVALLRARGERLPRGRTLAGLAALGGVGYVAQSLAFFTALQFASAGLVALLLYVYPAVVTIAAVVVFGERLTPGRTLALVLALTGTALTVGSVGSASALGVVLGLLSGVVYAIYIVTGSRLFARVGAVPGSTVIIGAAAASYGLLALLQRPTFPAGLGGWLAVTALALVSTVLAIVTFFAGVQRVGATDASTMSTLEPAVTVALAAVVLGEAVTVGQLAGGVLILTAVVLLARAGRRLLPPEDAPLA